MGDHAGDDEFDMEGKMGAPVPPPKVAARQVLVSHDNISAGYLACTLSDCGIHFNAITARMGHDGRYHSSMYVSLILLSQRLKALTFPTLTSICPLFSDYSAISLGLCIGAVEIEVFRALH